MKFERRWSFGFKKWIAPNIYIHVTVYAIWSMVQMITKQCISIYACVFRSNCCYCKRSLIFVYVFSYVFKLLNKNGSDKVVKAKAYVTHII